MRCGQTKIYDKAFLKLLLDLTEIADSYDQLNKIALLGDMLYSPSDSQYSELYKQIEATARHLRGLPQIGALEPQGNHHGFVAGPLKGGCEYGPCDASCHWSCHGTSGEPGRDAL